MQHKLQQMKINLIPQDLQDLFIPVKPRKPHKPKKSPQALKRLPGERRDFIPRKAPPIKEPPRLGPEITSRQSLRNQVAQILATYEGDALLNALVDWRNRGN
jgi:hypothetical protein